MAAPTRRHAQNVAAGTLAHLLTLPAPDVHGWVMTAGTGVSGQLSSQLLTLDVARQQLHQWAAVLKAPRWDYLRFPGRSGEGSLEVIGDFQGLTVNIWVAVGHVEGVTVAELATPPTVDASAEPDCDSAPGRSPELMLGGEL